MARVTKRLCMPVGQYTAQNAEKPTIEYREIGVAVEFDDGKGNSWTELKLNLDVLNPTLFQLARGMVDKGQSSARVKMFDVARKVKDKSATDEQDGPVDEEGDPY